MKDSTEAIDSIVPIHSIVSIASLEAPRFQGVSVTIEFVEIVGSIDPGIIRDTVDNQWIQ